MKKIFSFFSLLLILTSLKAQDKFMTVTGSKAAYTVEVPTAYQKKDAIGANIDVKYVNTDGASIITAVKDLPEGMSDSDIKYMDQATDETLVDGLQSNGMLNIKLLKRGFLDINGVNSFYMYYADDDLYFHSITQFKNNKIINLTYTCPLKDRSEYMPYIYRVVNSLTHK